LYIKGFSYKSIIAYLHENKIPSVIGNEFWSKTTIMGIVRNEKYCGDMILGKYFYKFNKHRTNHVEYTDMMMVRDNHEGIISKETFSLAQQIRQSRNNYPKNITENKSPYTGFIYSVANEKHLKFVIERPKGRSGRVKSEIPTLYCYSMKPGTKRVGFQVKVIMDLLEKSLKELRLVFKVQTSSMFDELEKLSILMEKGKTEDNSDGINILMAKMRINEMIKNYKWLSKTISFGNVNDIDTFRKIFNKVIVRDESIAIKISLTDDTSIALEDYICIHQFSFTYLKLFKEITYPVFLYFGGSYQKVGIRQK
jgi:hypothetical protein